MIREFKTRLHLLKTNGEYQGIEYLHVGPVRLSDGEESAAIKKKDRKRYQRNQLLFSNKLLTLLR